MQESNERYPRTYQGAQLNTLGISSGFRGFVESVEVASDSSMVIALANQTIAVDVQAPIQSGRAWTIRIEHTLLPGGSASVIAEAHPIQAMRPSLPNGEIITLACELAALAAHKEQQLQKTSHAVIALVKWMAPGALPSPLLAKEVLAGHVTVGYERTATGDAITLRIDVGGPWGPAPSELFQ